MIVCSATLHNVDVKRLAVRQLTVFLYPANILKIFFAFVSLQERLMHFPTWVDLKGQDAVPETVHHVVCYIDPKVDTSWHKLERKVKVGGQHARSKN